MNVKNPELVIARGINSKWFKENYSQLWIGFGPSTQSIPVQEAYYIGLYREAPISKVTHIGIVDRIERYDNGVDYFLKAIVALAHPFKPAHQIRKHVYHTLADFGLTVSQMNHLRGQLSTI